MQHHTLIPWQHRVFGVLGADAESTTELSWAIQFRGSRTVSISISDLTVLPVRTGAQIRDHLATEDQSMQQFSHHRIGEIVVDAHVQARNGRPAGQTVVN